MDLTKIYKMQEKLDAKFAKRLNFKKEDVTKQRILALFVEISEFANEIMSFKYWKLNKQINQKKVLEEFVDGIHFFTTMALELDASKIIEPYIKELDINDQLLELLKAVIKLKDNYTKSVLEEAYSLYFGIAKILNINDPAIEEAYIVKNRINYKRINNGY